MDVEMANQESLESTNVDEFQRLPNDFLPPDCYGESIGMLILIIDNGYLRACQCFINEKHDIVICNNLISNSDGKACRQNLSRSNFPRHLRRHHQFNDQARLDPDKIKRLFGQNDNRIGGKLTLPSSKGQLIPKVNGLQDSVSGFACNQCYFFRVNTNHSHSHAGVDDIWQANVRVQKAQQGPGAGTYFGVEEPISLLMWDAIDARRAIPIHDPSQDDERFLTPFQRDLRWHQDIRGKDQEALRALAHPALGDKVQGRIRAACNDILLRINGNLTYRLLQKAIMCGKEDEPGSGSYVPAFNRTDFLILHPCRRRNN
jgi:hypothetical protein